MQPERMIANNVMVQLDPSNEIIETRSGLKLYMDTSYEPEKHVVRIGEVTKAPDKLIQTKGSIPWETDVEIRDGDKVVMYFLAVQNCLAPERKNYIRKNGTVWIFIKYHNIYAAIRNGKIMPVNGYLLVEPVEDPEWIRRVEKAKMNNIDLPDLRKASNVNVVYGKIAYMGKPNRSYDSPYKSDDNYDLNIGDIVVMKRIRDIPVEYEYHAKIDGGRKLYRVQRHDILAVL